MHKYKFIYDISGTLYKTQLQDLFLNDKSLIYS